MIGFILISPSRKLIFGKIAKKFKKENNIKKNYIDGDFEDIDDDNERKIKIVSKFIKDLSGETPDIETYIFVKLCFKISIKYDINLNH